MIRIDSEGPVMKILQEIFEKVERMPEYQEYLDRRIDSDEPEVLIELKADDGSFIEIPGTLVDFVLEFFK